MPAPILATKLYIPPPRSNAIPRPRLVERLNAGGRLALVSAAAGFGKTTLLCEWLSSARLAGSGRKAAWLSLDEGDSDLARFLVYLVAAVQTAFPGVGAGLLAALQSQQPPPAEHLLAGLLNELAALPEELVLVLDDYHLVDASAVDEMLAFLLDHLPPRVRLVIATREDPRLPLARLRARGELVELRAADLRFTPAEAAAFLNQVMGLELSPEDVAALEARTEGWIAGLQLAALALQGEPGRSGAASFLQSFTGSRGSGVHRFILDYLVEEVLHRQPPEVRAFLLQTSILERFNAELGEAVRSQSVSSQSVRSQSGQEERVHRTTDRLITDRLITDRLIDYLDRSNLFIIPLDNERRWYRYHHLFAEVLKARLLEEQPDLVPTLHRRASAWYEQNGMQAEAIRHALAGADFVRAAGLIELAWPGMDTSYQSAAWLGWVRALPDALVRARPVLSLGYAWALLDTGALEASEARLRDAERWLEGSQDGMVVMDRELFRSLPAAIATARAFRSMALGDIPATVAYARQALERTPEDDYLRRIQAVSLLGMAQYANGDLEAAWQAMQESAAYMRNAGDASGLDVSGPAGVNFVLAEMQIALGRLHEAERLYQQALRSLKDLGQPPVGTSELYRGLGMLCCERGDLEAAAQHLATSQKLGEQAGLPNWQPRLYTAQARLKEAQGDLDGALARLEEAERLHVRSALPEVRPTTAIRARVLVRQGRLGEAKNWAREQGLSAEDALSYLREFEHITLARLLIAQYQSEGDLDAIQAALRLLERLAQAAEASGRVGSRIEILILQALAYQAHGQLPPALAVLERALALAGPQGYLRVFVDEGEPMADLLAKVEEKGVPRPVKAYVHTLLAGFGAGKAVSPSLLEKQGRKTPPLAEALSEREMDVLRLLRTEMSGPEIARELAVSLNTLRTHTKNIFGKLGVSNRRAAVRQAEELGLV